jgi:hypothetical protein
MGPRRTGRQTVRRNITWNWTCVITLQIIDSSSRQIGRPTSTNPQLSKNNQRAKGKKWLRVPDGCLTPRRTGRLTVCRNITLTLTIRDSTVCIATGYGLDGRVVGVRVSVGSRIFCSSLRPYRLWGSSGLLYKGHRSFFGGSKVAEAWSWPLTSN